MPIYEYICKSCGFTKDALQKLSDAPLTICPECNAEEFVKKVSAPTFRLKGSGWYETDFKTGKKKNLAGDDKSDKKSSGNDSPKKDEPKKGSSKSDSVKTSSTKKDSAA